MPCDRIIGHLDMDAFFASLEERASRSFKGKPIVVGSDPKMGVGRGVVSTANYKAREYGIHSALPISKAWQLSEMAIKQGKEAVVFLPVNFSLYERSSVNILNIIKKYSEKVEQGSIDEFYFELTSEKSFKKAELLCVKIKDEIREKEGVTCSIGIGPNKLISKIAAGINKPDGFLSVRQEDAESFLAPLPIRKIPGIGPRTANLLYQLNITKIEELKRFSKEELKRMLNKAGEAMYYASRGIDFSPIAEHREIKSIGEQTTFEENNFDITFIVNEFLILCDNVFKKFEKTNFVNFTTVAITIRFSDFNTKTSVRKLSFFIKKNDLKKFKLEALRLLLPFLDRRKNPELKLIRLIGVRVENFSNLLTLI